MKDSKGHGSEAHGAHASGVDQVGRPRDFYRGVNPGDTRRISTGDQDWDKLLFMSSNRDSASSYGSEITKYAADSDAKILYDGTAAYRSISKGLNGRDISLLQHSSEVAKRAAAAGYDAVHFARQGDVGTAIINPAKFRRVL